MRKFAGEVWDKVEGLVREQVGVQITNKLSFFVRYRATDKVWDYRATDKVWDYVRKQVWEQVLRNVNEELHDFNGKGENYAG